MIPSVPGPARRWLPVFLLVVALPAPAAAGGTIEINPIVTSNLDAPLAARHAGDGSGRLFIVEQEGVIKIWDGSQLLATPFLDIRDDIGGPVLAGGEQGLLGLDFDPDYENNGFFYVSYNFNPPGPNPDNCQGDPAASLTRVARYSVTGNPNIADPGSESVIIAVVQDFSNHNGGNILFGPDGFLYIGRGDGGSGGDPCENAQDPLALNGKMLRIDVSGSTFGGGRLTRGSEDCGLVGNYAIPPDNPFASDADGTCNEIWALGLRNPWRWSFDRQTGDLFIGDVGQENWEEVDFEPASSPGGSNWGWDCYEANASFEPAGCGPAGDYDFPILDYSSGGVGSPDCPNSSGNCAVTGGYRYRGLRAPSLAGTYILGDNCSGRVYFATESGGNWTCTEFANTTFFITSFGEDQEGEVYLVDGGGGLHRFEESIIFADGFELGDTSRWSTTTSD
jgi:glucose/arabinose dehydrogenase